MTNAQPKHDFCTEYARAAGEPLAGWGTHPAKNILIQWPKRHWRHSMQIAAEMSNDLIDAIEDSVEQGWRVNLIDSKSKTAETLRVYVFPDARAFDVSVGDVATLLRAITDDKPHLFTPQPLKQPLIVCCTHGKHDRCCAKFGFASYRAIAAAAGDRVSVWEITHLGGCRLSASIMAFPQMHKYGRVGVSDAVPLIDATVAGTPYLPRYRGASHLSPPAQVAEIAVLQLLAKEGMIGPLTLTETNNNEEQVAYRFSSAQMVGEVVCQASEVATFGNCNNMQPDASPAVKKVWNAEILLSNFVAAQKSFSVQKQTVAL